MPVQRGKQKRTYLGQSELEGDRCATKRPLQRTVVDPKERRFETAVDLGGGFKPPLLEYQLPIPDTDQWSPSCRSQSADIRRSQIAAPEETW
jgi:hypothetical protein